MSHDPFAPFKARQREVWSTFSPLESLTTMPAGHLARFAGVRPGEAVLDVACGTGVVSVTAARAGARATGLDLTPPLLERARENARLAGVEITFVEGDAEALPFPDASFDVVLSQFGHMFAPRPDVATTEMLRVLRPGGRIAFSTWPPEHLVGRMFALVGRAMPPPDGVAPPPLWGDPRVVRERLGDRVEDVDFERGILWAPTLSPAHYRALMEATGPLGKVSQALGAEELAAFDTAFTALVERYLHDNAMRQDYLVTRARKR